MCKVILQKGLGGQWAERWSERELQKQEEVELDECRSIDWKDARDL
jgi:hypothetical protein